MEKYSEKFSENSQRNLGKIAEKEFWRHVKGFTGARHRKAKSGAEYDPDRLYYAAHEGEALLGVSQFHIEGDTVVIDRVRLKDGTDDHLAKYLLAKAPLNFADLCGIQKARFDDPNRDLARELEFIEKDGVFTVNLDGYFTSPCKRRADKTE